MHDFAKRDWPKTIGKVDDRAYPVRAQLGSIAPLPESLCCLHWH
jgi:hypothetical protein